MKILLDECLPVDFRHSFPEQQTHTVEWACLKGKKNGEMIRAAVDGGYQVLLTVDQGINPSTSRSSKLSILVIRSRTNQIEDLLPFVPGILEALGSIKLGEIVVVP